MKSYERIFTGSVVEVLKIKEVLAQKNIVPVIKDNAESARLAGFGAPPNLQQVFVHIDELEVAKKLLDSI